MEKEEIIRLRKMKEKLFNKAVQLRDKLMDQEEGRCQPSINLNITLLSDNENDKSSKKQSTISEARLCEISAKMTGITFKDVCRKWLHDEVYLYTAKVVTKTVSFNLELTVLLKNLDDFKIEDIMCHFVGIEDCHMLEISSWFQKITSTKNFSLLMSALADYNEKNILRSKILHNLEERKYANVEQCTEENGGLLVHISSPIVAGKSYIIFQWEMKFLDLTWHIEHFFTVKPTDRGIEFFQENSMLLKEFCKVGLTKENLVELWDRLCIAIDVYDKTEYVE